MNESQPNHVDFLVWCFSSWRESSWIKSIRCDSTWRDSIVSEFQIFCCHIFQLQKQYRVQHFWKGCRVQGYHLSMYHTTKHSFWENPISLWWILRCKIPPVWYPVGIFLQLLQVGSSWFYNYHSAWFLPFARKFKYPDFRREMFQSPCPRMAMVAVSWLDFMMVVSLVILFKLTTVRLKGYNTPIEIILVPKVSAERQRSIFHPSVVGLSRLIRH